MIRPAVPDDEACLASMWLKSYAHSRDIRESGLESAGVDGHSDEIRYWKIHQPIVTALLRGGTVRVACDPERADYQRGPAVIVAWSCTTPGRVHWVGIKRQLMAIRKGEIAAECIIELMDGALADENVTATFDLMDLRTLHKARGAKLERWRYDRGWLAALRSISTRVMHRDGVFMMLGQHLLDRTRPEWSTGTGRAA